MRWITRRNWNWDCHRPGQKSSITVHLIYSRLTRAEEVGQVPDCGASPDDGIARWSSSFFLNGEGA
jgi:hypothetical protein